MEQPHRMFFADELKKAVRNRQVSEDAIDDHVHPLCPQFLPLACSIIRQSGRFLTVEDGYRAAQEIAEKFRTRSVDVPDFRAGQAQRVEGATPSGRTSSNGAFTHNGQAQNPPKASYVSGYAARAGNRPARARNHEGANRVEGCKHDHSQRL
jgi:hypothetical protein